MFTASEILHGVSLLRPLRPLSRMQQPRDDIGQRVEIMDEETKPVTYSSAPAYYTAVDHQNIDSGAPVAKGENDSRHAADSRKQAWPQIPPNLNNGMDCADAPRNLRENLASETGEWTWLQNRNACLSELSLSFSPFLKTLLFECLPVILSWPLCTLIEGPAAAANRHLNPLTDVTIGNFPFKVLGWIFNEFTFGPQGVTWALIFFAVTYGSDLPASAPFEIFGMILLAMLAKALVVSFKYGFKSDLLLSTGMAECLYNDGYRLTKQGGITRRACLNVRVSLGLVQRALSSCCPYRLLSFSSLAAPTLHITSGILN